VADIVASIAESDGTASGDLHPVSAEPNAALVPIDSVTAPVAILDPCGRIIRLNGACERATGLSSAEVEGKYLWDIFPPLYEQPAPGFARTERTLTSGEYEGYFKTQRGAPLIIHWSMSLLPTSDAAVRFIIATGVDRTETIRLKKAVLEISEREQQRIGRDLHDRLGEHLAGIAFLTKAHEQVLAARSLPEAAEAARIVRLVNRAIHKTRELARGLVPVLSESRSLTSVLQDRAAEVQDLFNVRCRIECDDSALLSDHPAAIHLYYIAQEAVQNAIKHGKAESIRISLTANESQGSLTILDDGCGMISVQASEGGLGLRIMEYRAGLIGGILRVEPAACRGTLVSCSFPLRRSAVAAEELIP